MENLYFIKLETNSLDFDRQAWKITFKPYGKEVEEYIIPNSSSRFNSKTRNYLEDYYGMRIEDVIAKVPIITDIPYDMKVVSMNKDFNVTTIKNTHKLKSYFSSIHLDLNTLFLQCMLKDTNDIPISMLNAEMMFTSMDLKVKTDIEYVEAMEVIFKNIMDWK